MGNAVENPYALRHYQRPALAAPQGARRVLLHSCCAPCAGEVILATLRGGLMPSVFFYNPNIHPAAEYEMRKRDNRRFCEAHDVPCIDGDYDRREVDGWFAATRGLENEPERGARCTVCFDVRFEVTAKFAVDNGFSVFASTLGISRWKNFAQINACGERAAAKFSGLHYWTFNWRKQGGGARMLEISKQEGFYQQEYCGCVYSLRDTNRHRRARGRARVERGVKFYGRDGLPEFKPQGGGNAPKVDGGMDVEIESQNNIQQQQSGAA